MSLTLYPSSKQNLPDVFCLFVYDKQTLGLETVIWISGPEETTVIPPVAMKSELVSPRLPAVVRWVKPGELRVSCVLL